MNEAAHQRRFIHYNHTKNTDKTNQKDKIYIMITLRPLQLSDALFMLEWMHDYELVKDLHKDFSSITIENCENFIKSAG